MGLITSSTYLAVFTSGSVVGASIVYAFTRLAGRRRDPLEHLKIATVPIEERYQFPDLGDEYRLVIGIRNDLKMQKGKVAAQCGHASVAAYRNAHERDLRLLQRWMEFGGTKITVKVDSEEELLALEAAAKKHGVLSAIVRDAGQTQVAPGSRTVIAIGPAPKSQLDSITGHLKLY